MAREASHERRHEGELARLGDQDAVAAPEHAVFDEGAIGGVRRGESGEIVVVGCGIWQRQARMEMDGEVYRGNACLCRLGESWENSGYPAV